MKTDYYFLMKYRKKEARHEDIQNTTNQYHTKRMEGSPDDQNTTNNDAVKRYSRHCSQI